MTVTQQSQSDVRCPKCDSGEFYVRGLLIISERPLAVEPCDHHWHEVIDAGLIQRAALAKEGGDHE